ncbi:MAG: hypothetical protein IKD62_05480, partial [Oscillospiraceae bacterium]|nr:hypothetical protein [Oscillospiraceae bacterium]
AAQYDEFFSRVALPDGTHTSPKDFITTDAAQSFLYFGVDPAGQPVREAGKEYEQGGFLRAVYTPNCIHPAATYNPEACAEAMQFFDAAFGAPNPIDPTSQIWMVKMFAGAAGVIALIAFAAFFMLYMIEKEDFKSLATMEEVKATPFADKAGKGWYWCGFIVCALFALISYPAIYRWVTGHRANIFATQGGEVAFFQQLNTFYIGLWSLMCAVVMFIITVISYNAYGKKHGVDLRESGVILPKGAWWKTIKLSLLTVIAMMSVVYISDHFFTVDYRIWIWPTFRAFKAFHWAEIWKYFIFFVPYYVMLSVSTNCFNYKALGKKGSEGLGLFVNCLSAALAPLLFIAIQYIPLYIGGHQFTEIYETGGSLVGLWLFPVAFILPFAVILGRAVYKKTKNPYLVGIMMGVLIAIVTASNQLTNP